jgi:hypothetical protein
MKFFPGKKKEGEDGKSSVKSEKQTDAMKQQIAVDESNSTSTAVLETNQESSARTKETIGENNDVAKIMEIIASSKDHILSPSIDFEKNQLYYPQLASMGDYEHVQNLLDNLSSPTVNILEKGVYERLAVCPEHSKQLSAGIRLYCSSCFSTDIVKLHLIEHKACGYISEIKDMTNADLTKCVSCKHTFKDVEKEIRRLGRWYQCNKCNTKFDNCVVKLHCRQFNHDFEINQASMIPIPYYKTKSDVKSPQVYALSIVPQVSKKVESHGFIVQDSLSIKGKSGITHKADLYATNNKNQSVLIDIKTSENEVPDTDVHSMIVKVLDLAPFLSILVTIPKVSDTAKTMASSANISVVTGNNISEIITSINEIINTRLSQAAN